MQPHVSSRRVSLWVSNVLTRRAAAVTLGLTPRHRGFGMTVFDRRAFLRMTAAGGITALQAPAIAWAQTANCVTGGLPAFLPTRLSVDCASKRNFQVFR